MLATIATKAPTNSFNELTFAASDPLLIASAVVAMPSPNTAYNLNSVSLGAGTWVVLGMYLSQLSSGDTPAGLYLNSASAVASNSWTTINQGSGTTPLIVGAVVKLTGTTTIYLNCQSSASGNYAYGFLVAVQIA